MHNVQQHVVPERTIVSITRHLHEDETTEFFDEAFARLRAVGPGVEGLAGVPFLIFYGEVTEDSDGPIELCRPVDADPEDLARTMSADIQVRTEPAHDEVFVRLAMKEAVWPATLPAFDALEAWTKQNGREPIGAPRQNLIADQRTATPDTPVMDLSLPLR
jgi:hypothetical protein